MIGFENAVRWIETHPGVRQPATEVGALTLVLLAFGPHVAVAFTLFRCAQWAARFTAIRGPEKYRD